MNTNISKEICVTLYRARRPYLTNDLKQMYEFIKLCLRDFSMFLHVFHHKVTSVNFFSHLVELSSAIQLHGYYLHII